MTDLLVLFLASPIFFKCPHFATQPDAENLSR